MHANSHEMQGITHIYQAEFVLSTQRAYREYIKEFARYRLHEQQPMNLNPLSQLNLYSLTVDSRENIFFNIYNFGQELNLKPLRLS